MHKGVLSVESQSRTLDSSLRQGLTAITVLAFISFFSAAVLFFYLAYKLVWHMYIRKPSEDGDQPVDEPRSFQRTVDFALGIDGLFADQKAAEERQVSSNGNATRRRKRQPPNQFIILIFNLLLADMHQGVAFFLNAEWLRRDEILVHTPTCFAQGLFVSTGDLASSLFITTIAIHTYLSVVKRLMPSHRFLYITIACIWVFVYGISVVPILATKNGAHYGGFYVRAGSWCWMNSEYPNLRLLTHYLFIFLSIAITSALYIAIYINLRRQARNAETSSMSSVDKQQLSHNPAFLIYPVIYVICTLPLALGRLAGMTGADVPLGYLCFAGAMIASNGSFDCLLFGTTRNVIVFASKHEIDKADVGLNTFTFIKTPKTRRYGNMVWVQGGDARQQPVAEDKTTGGWWSWKRLGGGGGKATDRVRSHRRTGSRSVSQESLRGVAAIQMDTVTTVVVEMEPGKDRDPRYPDPTASASPSVNSAEKEYPRES